MNDPCKKENPSSPPKPIRVAIIGGNRPNAALLSKILAQGTELAPSMLVKTDESGKVTQVDIRSISLIDSPNKEST